jgi:mannose-6-phosphate isomerase-like protein (cupin superfamily)
MRQITAVAAILLFPARFLVAQAPAAPATIMTMERLRAIGDSLMPAASRTAQLGRGSGYTYALTHRDSSGTVEAHAQWTDVFVVQSGTATLLTGGVAEGARETTPGEWRGGTARGATRAAIKPGDVIVIPAGTPHQMLLAPGERISYLGVKIGAGPKP